jgi:BASS family bile acid:Na+ symporter
MTLAHIIGLGVNASVFLIVLALGLRASPHDVTYLFKRPALLARSIFSMNIVMVIFAAVAALVFNVHPAVKIALVALACSPVPPILPNQQRKAGGTEEYAIGLLSTMAAAAIVVVPFAIEAIGRVAGLDIHISFGKVASIVFMSVLFPLIGGVLVHAYYPDRAQPIARSVQRAGTILLVVCLVPILIKSFPAFLALIGNGVLVALVLFAVIGLAVGHFLGGPDPANRTVLALATATRHPGVALAIASVTFPDQKAVGAVLIWHLLVGALVAAPYVRWRARVCADAGYSGVQTHSAMPHAPRG